PPAPAPPPPPGPRHAGLMADSPQTAARPVAFAALRHADFRAYFFCSAAAMMADNIEHVISYWVMFQKFHSPALAGFAVLSHWLPFLLFSVYFGALADRYDCRRIIQLAQFLFMAVSIAWALLCLTDTIQMWHAAVLRTVYGKSGGPWASGSPLLVADSLGG